MAKKLWIGKALINLFEDEGEDGVNFTSLHKDFPQENADEVWKWINENYKYQFVENEQFSTDVFFSKRPFHIDSEGRISITEKFSTETFFTQPVAKSNTEDLDLQLNAFLNNMTESIDDYTRYEEAMLKVIWTLFNAVPEAKKEKVLNDLNNNQSIKDLFDEPT